MNQKIEKRIKGFILKLDPLWPLCCGILLIGVVLRSQYGCFAYCDVSAADEASRSADALLAFHTGHWSLSLYDFFYRIIFYFFSTDLLVAQIAMRILATVISVLGLYILIGFSGLSSWAGAFLVACFWNINCLNSPIVQSYAMSLLCFGIGATSIGLWIKGNKLSRSIAVILALLVGFTRPEFFLIIAAYLFQMIFYLNKRIFLVIGKEINDFSVLAVSIFIIVLLGVLSLGWTPVKIFCSRLDAYLFFGFQQCYAAFVQIHEANRYPPFSWAIDYGLIMKKDFPLAKSFWGLLCHYPLNVMRYLFLNFFSNVCKITGLFETRSILLGLTFKDVSNFPWTWILRIETIFLNGVVISSVLIFWDNMHKNPNSFRTHCNKAIFWVGIFSLVSLPSLLLLIPRDRYWITLIPVAYIPLAWFISKFLVDCSRAVKIILVILVCIVVSSPYLTYSINIKDRYNVNYIRKIRKLAEDFPKNEKINVLSNYQDPFFLLADPLRFELQSFVGLNEKITLKELLELKRYNLFVLDDASNNFRYMHELDFVNEFQENPEAYGYKFVFHEKRPWDGMSIYRLSR